MPEPGSPAEALALSLAQLNAADAVSYATEAGIFQEAGTYFRRQGSPPSSAARAT